MPHISKPVNRPSSLSILLHVVFALSAFGLHANPLVKSVDAQGNVSYSDKPVSGAEKVSTVPIQSGPNASEIEVAQQQAQKKIQAAQNIEPPKKTQKKPQPATEENTESQPKVIINGTPRRPIYGTRPRPPGQKPPGQKPPGINPPKPSHPIARHRR